MDNIPFTDYFNQTNIFNKYWTDDSFGAPKSYSITNGHLKITTRAHSYDRIKVKTKRKNFGIGTYEWNIYVPKYSLNDQCSIGAFLYHSGKTPYEIDFEIGSGSKQDREKTNAKLNQAIVHCTSQLKPHSSKIFVINTETWHNFKLELTEVNHRYFVKWYLNNELLCSLQTKIKTKHKFTVHNSLENLTFMGEQLPSQENYVLFDSFKFY